MLPDISTSGPALTRLLAALLCLLCLLSACDNDGASDVEVFRDTLKDGGAGPEMVVLPVGIFRMGDLSADRSGAAHERDSRLVAIRRPIAMGRYEVTFEDYERFVLAAGADIPNDQGWGRGRRPVINVNREDATAYAQWLSAQTGQRYRLPSEAEWEYAARAGTETKYSWGDEIGRNRANCLGCGSQWDKQTAPVGGFAANAFGLHDMHGNVWEWVADCYGSYADAPTDGRARTDCDDGPAVARGGSWFNLPRDVRSALRGKRTPDFRDKLGGFRLVRDLRP